MRGALRNEFVESCFCMYDHSKPNFVRMWQTRRKTPSPSTAITNDAGTNASKEAAPSNNEAAADTETESTETFVAAVKELVDGLKTGAEKGSIDWAKSQELYNSKIKSVVQARDAEAESQINEKLEAAANAGKDGSLEPAVVAQIHDKLLQNIAFLTLRHDFTEANEKFTDKETVSQRTEGSAYCL